MTVGIGDDAAVVEPERNRLEVLTVDALVEGVHFDRRFTPPDAIGHRALAVNLSDLAAMGAAPRLALLSLALPPSLPCAEFDGMIAGLAALASRYSVHVAGGNLTTSPGPLVVDITVLGTVKRRQVLTRRGASPGDEVYVSGTIGAAAAGLELLRKHAPAPPPGPATDHLVRRFLYPEPRVRLGLLLGRNRAASACIDLSDGVADGVHQIARASGIGVAVDGRAVPIDTDARAVLDAGRGEGSPYGSTLEEALARGDDYELLFTVPPKSRGRLRHAIRHGDTPLTRIGVCTQDPSVVLAVGSAADVTVQPLPHGFGHFR